MAAAAGETSEEPKTKKRHGAFSQWWIISVFIVVNHLLAVPIVFFYRNVAWQIYACFAMTAWLALTGARIAQTVCAVNWSGE